MNKKFDGLFLSPSERELIKSINLRRLINKLEKKIQVQIDFINLQKGKIKDLNQTIEVLNQSIKDFNVPDKDIRQEVKRLRKKSNNQQREISELKEELARYQRMFFDGLAKPSF